MFLSLKCFKTHCLGDFFVTICFHFSRMVLGCTLSKFQGLELSKTHPCLFGKFIFCLSMLNQGFFFLKKSFFSLEVCGTKNVFFFSAGLLCVWNRLRFKSFPKTKIMCWNMLEVHQAMNVLNLFQQCNILKGIFLLFFYDFAQTHTNTLYVCIYISI